jgi:hypothetical protein
MTNTDLAKQLIAWMRRDAIATSSQDIIGMNNDMMSLLELVSLLVSLFRCVLVVIFIHLVVVVVRGIVASKKKRLAWDNTHHFNAEIDASDKERYGRGGDKTALSMIQEWCLPVQDVNFLLLPLRVENCGRRNNRVILRAYLVLKMTYWHVESHVNSTEYPIVRSIYTESQFMFVLPRLWNKNM